MTGADVEAWLKLALAVSIGVIAWFLKDTAASLKEVRKMADAHEVALGRHDERLGNLEARERMGP